MAKRGGKGDGRKLSLRCCHLQAANDLRGWRAAILACKGVDPAVYSSVLLATAASPE